MSSWVGRLTDHYFGENCWKRGTEVKIANNQQRTATTRRLCSVASYSLSLSHPQQYCCRQHSTNYHVTKIVPARMTWDDTCAPMPRISNCLGVRGRVFAYALAIIVGSIYWYVSLNDRGAHHITAIINHWIKTKALLFLPHVVKTEQSRALLRSVFLEGKSQLVGIRLRSRNEGRLVIAPTTAVDPPCIVFRWSAYYISADTPSCGCESNVLHDTLSLCTLFFDKCVLGFCCVMQEMRY